MGFKKDISTMQQRKQRLTLLVGLLVTALPLAAQAQRKSPLEDAPAIRKRVELRSTRFELGAGGGTTLGQDFFHSVVADIKLAFHITDWISLGAFAGLPVTSMNTGFQDRVIDSLPDAQNPNIPREPPQNVARRSMNKPSFMAGGQVELTPFTGKYSLAGKLFAHYDFYALVGIGLMNFTSATTGSPPCNDTNATKDCVVTGLKIGPQVGVGVHSYINDFVALNLELRDIIVENNSAGRDVNGDTVANADDAGFESNYLLTLNLVFYLPAKASISN